MFDITASLAEAGDEVVLMGEQGALAISADDIALAMGTINYEVCCLINRRVPRLYWRYNKLASLRTLLGRE